MIKGEATIGGPVLRAGAVPGAVLIGGAVLLGGALLSACQPKTPPPGEKAANPPAASASLCTRKASAPWAGAAGYTVSAEADGAACTTVAVSLSIAGPDGQKLFRDDYSGADLPVLFDGVKDPTALEEALRSWLEDAARGATTADLPAWAAGADSPGTGKDDELPFYPAEGVDQKRYEAIRAAKAPLFCFLQGAESTKCLTFEHDSLVTIGLQVIPG